LQTKIIINSLEEETLLICIFPHFIGSIASQLRELGMILTNTHLSHPEISEFFLLQLNYTFRNMASSKISNKFIPSYRRSIIRMCSLIRLPPSLSCPL
jgi:hypothetical protein